MSALLPRWQASCRDAATLIREAVNLPTPQMIDLVSAAMRKTVDARDELIDWLRGRPDGPAAGAQQAALAGLNVALSELASVEYPGGLERHHLHQAESLLRQVLAEAEPRVSREGEPMPPAPGISGTIQGGMGEERVYRAESATEPEPEMERSG